MRKRKRKREGKERKKGDTSRSGREMKYRNRNSVTSYHKAKIGRKEDREEERKRGRKEGRKDRRKKEGKKLTDKHVSEAEDKDKQQHRQTKKWI